MSDYTGIAVQMTNAARTISPIPSPGGDGAPPSRDMC
jgi:hypothetical protein